MPDRELFFGTSGPHDAEVVLVGESWGEREEALQRPFVGTSGAELDRILAECGIQRDEILCTNLIAGRPHANETFRFFLPKASNPNAKRVGGLIPSDSAIAEVRRLYRQLAASPRTLVIATGNWSLWGLSRRSGTSVVRESNGRRVPEELQTYVPTGILNWRGSMIYCEPHSEFDPSPELSKIKLLPIIHPAAIMRDWPLRAPTVHDLKTRVPLALKDDWRPQCVITHSPPSFQTTISVLSRWLNNLEAGKVLWLSNDIETLQHRFISVMGFADSPTYAICIPFISEVTEDGSIISYWNCEEETQIISLLRRILRHPNVRIIGQNYIYDTQYIQHWLGITPQLAHDTMLAQNVVFPGTPKDLAYLSSLYCKYHWYWKDDVKDWDRLPNLQQLMDYNCIDNMRTFEIGMEQMDYIRAIGQEEQMKFKMQTNRLCLRMMNRGVRIDTKKAGDLQYQLMNAQEIFYRELLGIIPQDMVKPHDKKGKKVFWYSSPKQTQELFYNILGMDVVRHRKTGSPTVGKEALMVLERKYPEFTGLFRRLDYAGSVTNTLGVVKTPIEPDGRMRCSYNPGGTETHRLSSSENVFGRGTNLQNLTKGEEDD